MQQSNNKKIDRRVKRTHQLLRDALIDLSIEKGYDQVTIQEITERANLGRATFYLHFRDKDELLMRTLQELVDDLVTQIEPELEGMFFKGQITPLRIIFHHAAEHRALYQIILRGSGAAGVEHRLRSYTATRAQAYLEKLVGDEITPVPVDIAAHYFSSSLLGLVQWWLEQDMPYTADYMAQLFFDLGVSSILRGLGR